MGISGSKNGGTVPYKAIFWGYIPLHRPYVGLIYGRYLQFRFLKWLLIWSPIISDDLSRSLTRALIDRLLYIATEELAADEEIVPCPVTVDTLW